MATVKHVQLLRGNTQENDRYTGLEGELTVDLGTKDLRIHDDSTVGGIRVLTHDNAVEFLKQESHSTTNRNGDRVGGKLDGQISYEALDPDTIPVVDAELDSESSNAISNKAVTVAIHDISEGKADVEHTHSVWMESDAVAGDVSGLMPIALTAEYSDILNAPKIIDDVTVGDDSLVTAAGILSALNDKADAAHTHTIADISDIDTIRVETTNSFDPTDGKKATTGVAVAAAVAKTSAELKEFVAENYLSLEGGKVEGSVEFSIKPTFVSGDKTVEFATTEDVLEICGEVLPDQTDHAGEVLATNGESAHWARVEDQLSDESRAAVNSGITSDLVTELTDHVSDSSIHVTPAEKETWNAKQDALTPAQIKAVNSGITSDTLEKIENAVTSSEDHIANADIHVSTEDREKWDAKQDALTESQLDALNIGINAGDVSEIRGQIAKLEANDAAYNKVVDDFCTKENKQNLAMLATNPTALSEAHSLDVALDDIEQLTSDVDVLKNLVNGGAGTSFTYKTIGENGEQVYYRVETESDLPASPTEGATYLIESTGAYVAYINGFWSKLGAGDVNFVNAIVEPVTDPVQIKGANVPTDWAVVQYVDGAVSTVNAQVSQAAEKISALESRASSIEDSLEDLEEKDSELEGSIGGLDTRVGIVEGDINDIKTEISSLQDKASDLEWINDAFTPSKNEDGGVESVSVNSEATFDENVTFGADKTVNFNGFVCFNENILMDNGLTMNNNLTIQDESQLLVVGGSSLVVEDGEAKKLISTDGDGNKVYSEFATEDYVDSAIDGFATEDYVDGEVESLNKKIDSIYNIEYTDAYPEGAEDAKAAFTVYRSDSKDNPWGGEIGFEVDAKFEGNANFTADVYFDGGKPHVYVGQDEDGENIYVDVATMDDIPDVSTFITADDLPDVSKFITADDLPDLTGFATEDYVDSAIDLIMNGDADHDGLTKQIGDLRTTIDEQVGATDLLKDIFLGSEKEDSDGDLYNPDNWEGGLKDIIKANESAVTSIRSDVTSAQASITTLQSGLTSAQGNITTLQGNITTLDGDLLTLSGRVDVAEGNITSAQTDISTMQGTLTTATGNITNLQGDMVVAQSDIEDLKGRLNTAEGNITTAQSNITTLQGDLETLRGVVSSMGTGGSATEGDLAAIRLSISALESNMTSVKGDVATQDGKITSAEGNITTLQTSVSSLQGDMTAVKSDIETLKGKVSANETDIGNLQSSVSQAETDIGILQGDMTNVQGSVTTLDGNVSTLTTSVTNLSSTLNTATGDITTLQTSVSTMEGDITEIRGDITDLKAAVSALDLTEILRRLSTIETKIENFENTIDKFKTDNSIPDTEVTDSPDEPSDSEP